MNATPNPAFNRDVPHAGLRPGGGGRLARKLNVAMKPEWPVLAGTGYVRIGYDCACRAFHSTAATMLQAPVF
jgi:hypothetical protein